MGDRGLDIVCHAMPWRCGRMETQMKRLILAISVCAASGFTFCETLENDALRIRFADAEHGFNVAAIENRLVDDTRFVDSMQGQPGLWRLDFLSKGTAGTNEHVFVDNLATAVSRFAERTPTGMRFTWRGIDIADEKGVLDVFAAVDMPSGAAASEWNIIVSNRSVNAALFETSYPLLRGVVPSGKSNVLLPFRDFGAVLRPNFSQGEDETVAWSPGWGPSVSAFHLGQAGLYFAAHDPDFRFKRLVVGRGLDVRFDTIVENAGVLGLAAEGPRHAVTIAAYRGDWWKAAKMYRTWAMEQKWTAKGPMAKRTDYPKALLDMDLLFRFNEPDVSVMSNNLVAIKRIWPDLKTGVHWYCWNTSPFCVNFPEFFPARKGVKDTIAFAKALGIKIVPYVDPKLWDMDMVSWAYVKDRACRDWNGYEYVETYYSGHHLASMCPTFEAWREIAMKMTTDAIMSPGECVNGCCFDGIYHDQVACSRQSPCWAPGHDHPKGGGGWWVDGYRKAFTRIHDWCAKRGAMILTEGTGDMYLDLIDGYCKASGGQNDEVPFFPAVYSGYAICYGNYQNLKDSSRSFRAYQMRDFTCGLMLGWFDRWNVTSPEFAERQKFIGMLARIRRAAEDFMIYGKLEDEVRFIDVPPPEKFDLTEIWRDGKSWKYTLPVVTGTVWRDQKNSAAAIIVANATDKPQSVRFRLPAKGFKVQYIANVATSDYHEDGHAGVLTIPGASAAYLKTSL